MFRSDFFHMDVVNEHATDECDPVRDEQGAIMAWKKNIYSYPPIGSPDGGAYVTASDLNRLLRKVKAGSLLSPQLMKAFFYSAGTATCRG
jgi:hypothetical protein